MPIKQKRCARCKKLKRLNEFSHNRNSPDGHASWCKGCMSAYNFYRRHGISQQEYIKRLQVEINARIKANEETKRRVNENLL